MFKQPSKPRAAAIVLAGLLSACGPTGSTPASSDAAVDAEAAAQPVSEAAVTALLAPFEGPYGGVPAFDKVEVAAFEPAMTRAIAAGLEELEIIAAQDAAPDFENTIAALERQGSLVERVGVYYGIWTSNLSSPEVRKVEPRIDAMLADYFSAKYMNQGLFGRIETIWQDKETLATLSDEQQRLVWDYYTDFVRAGAALDEETRAQVAALTTELSGRFASFSANMLHDEQAYVTWLTGDQLSGLPENVVAAAASAARERDREGAYAILNTRSSMDPFLTFSDERDLREAVWRTYYSRGDNGDEYDNNGLIADILRLRQERARLQGYENFATYALEKRVAQEPDRAMDLLMQVWPAAVARVEEEVADMQAVADAEGAGITIAPWDYRYYAEKVRKAKYDLDSNEVKQYLELDNLVDGMFWMAGQLYGFTFEPAQDVPVFHEDVRVWQVLQDGAHQGLFYFDPYARTGKRSGAWMNGYNSQSTFDGPVKVMVSNNSNFIKPDGDDPVLISWDDAETLFHEFGHALHGLLSDVTYPSQAGTAVARDYVEFPSQVHENWLMTPEVLNRFALHYETGEPIPQDLVDRIGQAGTFNQGFATTEYLASALMDMKLHTLDDGASVDARAFEQETLTALGMPQELPMRHRLPHFSHVFSSDGYAAGYYAYLWSDTYGADAWAAFADAEGGAYDPVVAGRFVDHILSVGNSIDPVEGYRAFRGRDVDTTALMRQRGFPTGSAD
jgi:peptidyl-dipeptidase Dcp